MAARPGHQRFLDSRPTSPILLGPLKPPRSPYIVDLHELPAKRHIEIEPAFIAAAVAGLPMREALEPPAEDPDVGRGTLDVELYGEGKEIFASGTLVGYVRVACSRCIGPVDIKLDEQLRITYMPAADLALIPDEPPEPDKEKADKKADDADEGAEITEDDLDLFPYEDEKIDLAPMVREQYVLAIPYAPLCREDCAGLCPQCGIDRNTGTCKCEKPLDPRFAALASLKLPS